MKKLLLSVKILVAFFLTLTYSYAQEICMVSTNETGQFYIVYWEPLTDMSNMDSVLVYRKKGFETNYSQVGSVKIGEFEGTSYFDEDSDAEVPTKYAIALRDSSGNISELSPYHTGIVLDYVTNGEFIWTPYYKGNQVDESYIVSYECFVDVSGTGGWTSLGDFPNNQTAWTDANWQSHSTGFYYIEAEMPACEYVTKANINTSRSNIKQQISHGLGVENKEIEPTITVTPNPSTDNITIENLSGSDNAYWISNSAGQKIQAGHFDGKLLNVSVKDWSNGVYFINIHSGTQIISKRFVKN